MPCKICGALFNPKENVTSSALTFKLKPPCKCGKVRKRVRIEGCPKCGAKDLKFAKYPNILLLKKNWLGYYFVCKCGNKWRVYS
jgi:hypothetical protein